MDTLAFNTSEADERKYHAHVTGMLIKNCRSVKASVESRHAEMMQIGEQIQTLLRGKDADYAERVRYKSSSEFLQDFELYIEHLRKCNVSLQGVKVSVHAVSAEDVRRHFQRRQNLPFNEQLSGVVAANCRLFGQGA